MRCDECQFYSFPRSECRIAPPVFVAGFQGGQFPLISGDGWCGKWERDGSLRHDIQSLHDVTTGDFIAEHGAEFSADCVGKIVARIERRKSK